VKICFELPIEQAASDSPFSSILAWDNHSFSLFCSDSFQGTKGRLWVNFALVRMETWEPQHYLRTYWLHLWTSWSSTTSYSTQVVGSRRHARDGCESRSSEASTVISGIHQ